MNRQLKISLRFSIIVSTFVFVAVFQNCAPSFNSISTSGGLNLTDLSSLAPGGQTQETPAERLAAARSILTSRCAGCHNANNPSLGRIVFDTDQAFIDNRFVVAGSLANSKLITRLSAYPVKDGTQNMPPNGNLTPQEYGVLTSWVEKMSGGNSGQMSQNNFICDPNEAPNGLDARRLSKRELYNTLHQVISRPFGDAVANTILSGNQATFWTRLPNDNRSPFSKSDGSMGSTHTRAYFDLAEEVTNQLTNSTRINQLVTTYVNYNRGSCTTVDVNNLSAACRDAFIQNFLLRLWSRQPEINANNNNNELESYRAEFTQASVSGAQAVNNFVFRALISPSFLNHIYIDVDQASGVSNLSSLAVGRRLSYHFQLAGLSEVHLQTVLSNNLMTSQGFGVAVNQIGSNPSRMMEDFSDDWLSLHTLPNITSGSTAKWASISQGITFDNNLRQSMRQEIFDFMTYLYVNNRPVTEILTSNVSLARDPNLMRIYRQAQAAPDAPTEANAVRFPANERSGLTTRAAFLYNTGDTERPIHRGLHVMSHILCSEPRGAPPAGAADTPLPMGVMTIRDKVAQQTSAASCTGCHSQINPAGFSLGQYNAFGAFQDVEPIYQNNTFMQNLQVDASVNVRTFLDVNVNTRNAIEMNQQMAESHRFRACMTRYYHTYFNRLPTRVADNNSCQMRRMYELMENGSTVSDFFRSSVNDDQFKRRLIVK